MKTSICQHCQLIFIPRAGSYGKFCSLSCSSAFNSKKRGIANIQKYNESPTLCKCCGSQLPFTKRHSKFCSRSCAGKITNSVNRKRGPTATEKFPFSTIKFILCEHANKRYSNRNVDGSIRRCSPYIKTLKEQYYIDSRFKFNVYNYPNDFDLELIKLHGWYTCPGKKRKHEVKNVNGVSREHMISVGFGFTNNIDPKIISHPANCRLMLHSENKIKHTNCCMTINELIVKIDEWEQEHIERATRIELATNSLEG